MKWMELETYLERLAPSGLACSWDNSGLLAGRTDKEIKKIGVALDATMDAVLFGIKEGCDLLLTHHPLLFSPVKRICDDTVLGKKLLLLLRNDISLYAMHTTFDSARGGMADMAAEALGLVDTEPLEEAADFPGCGIGRVGNLRESMSLSEFAGMAKNCFKPQAAGLYVGLAGENQMVSRVAVCPGSGGDEIRSAAEKGAHIYVTGDLKYHIGAEGAENGLPLLNIDHYSMEKGFVRQVAGWLSREIKDLEVVEFQGENPCRFI